MTGLYIGTQFTGVTVERDGAWPGMWRIHQGDQQSDITNISRAKDAAIGWARPKGLGGADIARWHHRQSRAGAPPARLNEKGGAQ